MLQWSQLQPIIFFSLPICIFQSKPISTKEDEVVIPVVLTVNTTEPELDTAVMSVNVSSPPSSSQVSKEGFLDMFLKIPLEEVFDLHSDQWKASGKKSLFFLPYFCF